MTRKRTEIPFEFPIFTLTPTLSHRREKEKFGKIISINLFKDFVPPAKRQSCLKNLES
jgi:hypothetical protein